MSENEAIQWLKHTRVYQHKCDNCEYIDIKGSCNEECKDFYDIAIQALEEIQQYRAIGTVEEFKALKDINRIADNLSKMERIEFKALKEKSVAKKAEVNEFDYGEGYVCGECESFLHYVDDDDEHIRTNYCCHCGTKIDWQ